MKLTMPVAVTAADSDSRTISGTIVTWNEEGNTSAGRTKFAANSIALKNVKLFLEHDRSRPIGKVMEYNETETGIDAVFKIGKTSAGSDALVEAAEGLRDGFSVGIDVDKWSAKDGVMVITASTLVEVSLVESPAIDSARVSEVAASDDPNKEKEGSEMIDTPEVAADTEVSVEAAAEVKAAAPVAQPLTYARPRSPIVDKATYVEHSVRAALGNEDSRQFVAFADDTTTNNAGLIPTPQSTQLINGLSNADRGVIDALSRETLPAAGMTFEIPKITAVPTMAVVAEEGAISETGMTNSFISVPVKAFKGGQEFSVELLDRSSPAFFNELVRQMEFAYVKATSDYVLTRLVAVGGAYGPAANTAAGLVGYVSGAAAEAYQNSLGFARSLVVSPTQWGNIMGYNDTGRPIYNATQPSNAAGNVGPTSISGQVLGLNLVVDRNIGVTAGTSADSDLSMIVINPDAYTWYEGSKTTLRTDILATGQIKVAIVGYGALAEKLPLAGVWNDIAI
jgi:HK97 family phage prohead protease